MQIKLKRALKTSFDQLGINIRRARNVRPLDLSGYEGMDPISASYEATGRSTLIRVPLNRILTFGLTAFPATISASSPFIRTLTAYHNGACRNYHTSPLQTFYSTYQPKTAAELMGIASPSYSRLRKLPPGAALMSWRPSAPDNLAVERALQVEYDNREHVQGWSYSDGDPFFGPVSLRKGELEFSRLINIYKSISEKGFKVDITGIDNITVVCLVSKGEWRLMIVNSGQHRVAALAALGYETIIVQLQAAEGLGGIIRREEAARWPAVRKGFLTQEEALRVFDRVFEGRQPSVAKKWLEAI